MKDFEQLLRDSLRRLDDPPNPAGAFERVVAKRSHKRIKSRLILVTGGAVAVAGVLLIASTLDQRTGRRLVISAPTTTASGAHTPTERPVPVLDRPSHIGSIRLTIAGLDYFPYDIVADDAKRKIYVAAGNSSKSSLAALFIIDSEKREVSRVVQLEDAQGLALHVALDPGGGLVYVATSDGPISSMLWTIDATTEAVRDRVELSFPPEGLLVNASDRRLYVAQGEGVVQSPPFEPSIVSIDPTTGETVARIPVRASAIRELAGDDTGMLYTLGGNDNDQFLIVVDTVAGRQVNQVPLEGDVPSDLVVSPSRTHVYVADHRLNRVQIVDPRGTTVSMSPQLGNWPEGLTLMGGRYLAVAVNSVADADAGVSGSGELVVLDLSTGKSTSVSIGLRPRRVAFATTTKEVFVADFLEPLVHLVAF